MSFVYSSQLVRFLQSIDRLGLSSDFASEDAFELYHKIQEDGAGAHGASDSIGLPALGHALAGSAGTAISHLVLYPLSLAITRLQVQRQLRGPSEAPSAAEEADIEYKNLQDAARKIYEKEGGWRAFYTGCLTDTSKSIVDAFLFFLAYTTLRQKRQNSRGTKHLPVLDELSVGVLAGAFSKLITTPIQQIVTRKQTAAMVAARDPTSSLPPDQIDRLSIKDIALQIRSERGISGFWAGYSASLILTLNPSLTFVFHNLLKRAMVPHSKRDNPGPALTFLIAALSKAAASTVTYPFSLAKTRAQISAHPSPAFEDQPKEADIPYPVEPQAAASETSKPSEKASRSAKTTLRVLTQYLRQPTVIKSLQKIYRTEGFLALYSGLEGEVLKGFLGHGLTMLLKERIHVGLVKLYFYLLKVTKKWPAELGDVRDQAAREMDKVRKTVGATAVDAREKVGSVAETVREGVGNAVTSTGVGDAARDARDRAGSIATSVKDGAVHAVSGNGVADAAKEARERAANVAVTVKEGATNAVSANGVKDRATQAGERVENITTTVKEGAVNVVKTKKED